jgi:exopolysaccharide biosynthesis polyprenyl glycosylphosphotransferase
MSSTSTLMSSTGTLADEPAIETVAATSSPLRRQSVQLLDVRFVAGVGGALVVGLAVFVPYVAQRELTALGLMAVLVAAAIWTATIRGASVTVQGPVGTGISAATGSLTGLIAVAAIDPWFPGLHLGLPTLLGMAVGIWASAAAWDWSVQQTSAVRRRVLVVGTDESATAVAEEVGRTRAPRFHLVGRIETEGPAAAAGSVDCLGGLAELAEVVEAQRPDIVVLADEPSYEPVLDQLLDVAPTRLRVVGLAGFFEYAFGRVPLPHLTPAWFMGVLHIRQPLRARWSNRAFDLFAASVGLLLAVPLMPLIALLVRRTPGPILYRQTRLGESGRPFQIYKFRTMIEEAEASGEAQWCAEGDRRVTRVGKLLRRSHLDEVPQLWNVLKGEMSIVGPRPERPEFVAMLEKGIPFWNRRLLIKPGVTGWAQIRTGYSADCASCADKLSYDLWYIRHRTLAVDLAVCIKTASLMMSSLFLSSSRRHARFTGLRKGARS